LACGDQRRLTGNGSALEVVLHDYALYKSTFTLLYFTLDKGNRYCRNVNNKIEKVLSRFSYINNISETTTPINMKFQDSIWTTKMCPAMLYCDIITNPRWRTGSILKIAKSPYFSKKSCDFHKIWYTTADIEPHDSHVTKYWNFLNSRWRRPPSWK